MNKIKMNIAGLFNPNNSFIILGESAKRIPNLFISIPLIVIIIIVGVSTGEILVFKILLKSPQISPLFRTLYSFTITIFFVILLLSLWIKLYEKRPINTIGLKSSTPIKHYFKGFGLGAFMMLITVGLIALTGNVNLEKASDVLNIKRILPSCLMLFAYIIQGANEEFVSRGWQFQVISLKSRPWIGALTISIIFSLLHVGGGANLISFANLFLFSFLLVLFVLNDGSIWSACGWHSAWNWTMGSVLGLNVSGREDVGVLFDLSISGSPFVSGGKFGPERSIMATVVLASGILIFLYTRNCTKYNKTNLTYNNGINSDPHVGR
jgi:membrane protease YdiL (CAAX protease family)